MEKVGRERDVVGNQTPSLTTCKWAGEHKHGGGSTEVAV